jgi:endonuclease/exonuclease/phosphatase family metal-dependent hydrolase
MIENGVNKIRITTYNVENLFDKVDDPNKDDGPSKPDNELKALANVLKTLNSDILVLEEVENKEIVEQVLSLAGLKDKYNIIVGKSDGRGIAVALLIDKKFPIKKYTINKNETTFYRPPVEAIVELAPGFNVKIMGVHFKAKMDPYSVEQRLKEAKRAIELAKKDNLPTILAGDFNDLPPSQTLTLIQNNGFTDVRKIDLLSKDTNTPTHYTVYHLPEKDNKDFHIPNDYKELEVEPSIVDYITVTDNLKKYVVQGSFDVLEKQELPDTAIASDHRPVSIEFQLDNKK